MKFIGSKNLMIECKSLVSWRLFRFDEICFFFASACESQELASNLNPTNPSSFP